MKQPTAIARLTQAAPTFAKGDKVRFKVGLDEPVWMTGTIVSGPHKPDPENEFIKTPYYTIKGSDKRGIVFQHEGRRLKKVE